MFGDFSWSGSAATQVNVAFLGFNLTTADIPLAGGSRRAKVAEQNRALPTDRAYLSYHHFHNAFEATLSPAPNAPPLSQNSFSVNRYTVAIEKTFWDGQWSLEARLPFADRDNVFSSNPAAPGVAASQLLGGNVGDLTLIAKQLLIDEESWAVAAGVGLTAPTGSDVRSAQPGPPPTETLTIENQAFHILPFLACTATPSDQLFWHGFAQFDFAASGNRVTVNNIFAPLQTFRLNDQNLLHLDLGAGYWLYEAPCSCGLTGLATTLELHYTTTLQDADLVPLSGGFGMLGNLANRIDVLNFTVGLDSEFANGTHFRVAGVFPFNGEDERFFDAEIQASIIRRF